MATTRASAERAAADRTFEELYRGHHADVYRAALRALGNVHDAEDVTQAAFVDAYRAVLKGTQPQSPRPWLLAISENVRRRRFRTAQRRPREEPMDADFPLAADLPYEQAHALADALAALPAEQRRVFVLRELAGLSYDEIADEVEATVPAIQMLLFRARRSLRAQLEPPITRRKTGLLVPVPAWLTTLVSRSELASLTPRAAGAVGAVVIAVVGAGVAVSQAPTEGRPLPANNPQLPAASVVRPAPVVAVAPAPVARRPVASTKPLPAARAPRPARASKPAASPETSPQFVPAAAPVSVPVPATAPAPSGHVPAKAADTPVLERLRPRVPLVRPPLVRPKVRSLLEPPVAPVLPPLSTAPVLEAAAGAVDAAGASVPPLPVPVLPPVTLPPAP